MSRKKCRLRFSAVTKELSHINCVKLRTGYLYFKILTKRNKSLLYDHLPSTWFLFDPKFVILLLQHLYFSLLSPMIVAQCELNTPIIKFRCWKKKKMNLASASWNICFGGLRRNQEEKCRLFPGSQLVYASCMRATIVCFDCIRVGSVYSQLSRITYLANHSGATMLLTE